MELGISAEKLAHRIGADPSYILKIESESVIPSPEMVQALARELKDDKINLLVNVELISRQGTLNHIIEDSKTGSHALQWLFDAYAEEKNKRPSLKLKEFFAELQNTIHKDLKGRLQNSKK